MKEISLKNGGSAKVDDADFLHLSQHAWTRKLDKCGVYYAVRQSKKNDGSRIFLQMHRVVLELSDPSILIDHVNGDGLDNQRSNIRVCTQTQNMANRGLRKDNTSGFKGVCRAGAKWIAVIYCNGIRKCLGRYDSAVDAAIAYDLAAIRFFGDFARTNIIQNPI